MQDVQMTGELRTEMGTKAAKELRASGRIPCVMYGGKGENIHFTVDPNEVKHVIFTPEFKISNINIDGKNYRCIVREIQFHPVTDEISHIDFLALQDGVRVKTQIPLRAVGVAPGTRDGGKMILKMRAVDIKTSPKYLVDELTVDVSDMEIGITKRIKDIEVPENIKILNAPNIPVASIEIPRILRTSAVDEDLDLDEEDVDEEDQDEESSEESTEE